MLSTEGLPRPAVRAATVTRRFQKFLLVGAIGLAVNQCALFVLVALVGLPLVAASPVAILLSMAVTFTLNERWTWRDRGRGRLVHRALLYGSINSERAPVHDQIDIRVDYSWKWGPAAMLAYLDVQNVYLDRSVVTYFYGYDYTQKSAFESLPLIPSIGVRAVF